MNIIAMIIPKIKIEKWLPHILGLLLFLILPVFVFDRNDARSFYWIYSYYYQLVFMIVAFYVNYLVITPRFFFSKRRIYFFAIIILFVILLLATYHYFYNVLQFDNLRPDNLVRNNAPHAGKFGFHPKLIDNFFLLLLVLGFSSGMAIIQHFKKNETKQKEIEKAHVDSELAFLKNQISPHFFFNSLNNIYALIAIDGDKAQKAVEKLAILMRYLIYESNVKTVDIQKEFEFTQNYIDLMEQRLSSKVKLDVDIQHDLPKLELPPLLFIPFVENAFKHGISYRENSFISIKLKAEDDILTFSCNNSIPQQAKKLDETGGIGIVNVKKRLDLIYGEDAQLDISDSNSEYSVTLIIPLKPKL